jgi:hypothetical protein
MKTPMAASAGAVGGRSGRESFDRAVFTYSASGFRYRVRRTGEGIAIAKANGTLAGSQPLAWFVGSGATARHLEKAVALSPGFATAADLLAKLRSAR